MEPSYIEAQAIKKQAGDACDVTPTAAQLEAARGHGAKLYVDTTSLPNADSAAFYFAIAPVNAADFVVAVPADFENGTARVELGDALQEHPA